VCAYVKSRLAASNIFQDIGYFSRIELGRVAPGAVVELQFFNEIHVAWLDKRTMQIWCKCATRIAE
jgi:hypothetical protein